MHCVSVLRVPIVSRSRINRHPILLQPYAVKPRLIPSHVLRRLLPPRATFRNAFLNSVPSRHRSGYTTKTLPNSFCRCMSRAWGSMKPCPNVLRRAATRNLPISRFSNRRIFKPLNAMSCGLLYVLRFSSFRGEAVSSLLNVVCAVSYRCRSTTKTVQPIPISSPVI